MVKGIILASQSPRRKDLLAQMGAEFDVVPSNFDEQLDDSRTPEEVAQELALGKAQEVAKRYPDHIVIGSDTIVTIEGKQLGKPADTEEAKQMLAMLCGKTNEVTTGVAVICRAEGVELTGSETAHVTFKSYDETAIDAYIATGDPLDKAGAYGIQSGAAPLIESMAGNYDTVLGLPTQTLSRLLSELGVSTKVLDISPPVKRT